MLVVGHPLIASYSAYRSGHDLNNKLLRAVLADPSAFEIVSFDDASKAPAGFAELAPAW
jgi:UDP-3-O-[3-hydroxymyristoyl] N-acetylglucosamine deacetylase